MITIRNAVVSDAQSIFTIWADGWRYAYKNILSPGFLNKAVSDEVVNDRIKQFPDRLQASIDKGNVYLVATDGDEVIGFVSGGSIDSKECNADKELHGMYINPNYIGHGVGKILFQEFAQKMCEQGAKKFGLMCFSDNKSMGFYKKMGGIVTIERPSSPKFESAMGSFIEFNIDEVLNKR
jgi:RimJ/RimL family protein N-acetyltransferase